MATQKVRGLVSHTANDLDLNALGISVTDLVRVAGVSRNTIKKFLSGEPVREHTAIAIRNAVQSQSAGSSTPQGKIIGVGLPIHQTQNDFVGNVAPSEVVNNFHKHMERATGKATSPLEQALIGLKHATAMFQSATYAAAENPEWVTETILRRLGQQIGHLHLYEKELNELLSSLKQKP